MHKVLCIETLLGEFPFEERFSFARVNGFECIEFWSWKNKNIKAIEDCCKNNGVNIAAFSGDQDFSLVSESEREQYISFAKESIEVAKQLHCRCLVIHSNALDKNGIVLNQYEAINSSKKIQNMVDTLKILAPLAKKADVTLVLEALNTKVDHAGYFLNHTEDAIRVVELVGSPNVKILYDIYHMQIMEGNLINTIKKYIDLIGHIHIADVPGRHEPETGEINFKNIIGTLKSLNYKGAIGFELYPLHSSQEALEVIKVL